MQPRVVIFGAYGTIGSACARAFSEAGFYVVGVGRSPQRVRAGGAVDHWHFHDLGTAHAEVLFSLVRDADVVVNAAGTFGDSQDGELVAITEDFPRALTAALAVTGRARFVHISAAGAKATHARRFFRSKWRGERAVAQYDNAVILRPAAVLTHDGQGLGAALRCLAAVPMVHVRLPMMHNIQTIDIDDLCDAVLAAAHPQFPRDRAYDVAAPSAARLDGLARDMRGWLGFAPWRGEWRPSTRLAASAASVGAVARKLGWGQRLRGVAMMTGSDVRADLSQWQATGAAPFVPVEQALAYHTATRFDRMMARMSLLAPLLVVVLCLVWAMAGLDMLIHGGGSAVILGAVQILLAGMVLWRRSARVSTAIMSAVAGLFVVTCIGLADPVGAANWCAVALASITGFALLDDR